ASEQRRRVQEPEEAVERAGITDAEDVAAAVTAAAAAAAAATVVVVAAAAASATMDTLLSRAEIPIIDLAHMAVAQCLQRSASFRAVPCRAETWKTRAAGPAAMAALDWLRTAPRDATFPCLRPLASHAPARWPLRPTKETSRGATDHKVHFGLSHDRRN
ncbi:Protein of unknown function, partial [Gryllus bimaculatus]